MIASEISQLRRRCDTAPWQLLEGVKKSAKAASVGWHVEPSSEEHVKRTQPEQLYLLLTTGVEGQKIISQSITSGLPASSSPAQPAK